MRPRGFTLLEALIALGVAAVLLAAVYSAVGRAAVVRERTERTAERLAASRRIVLRLAGEVEAAVAPRGPAVPERFVVGAPREDAPAWSTLRFATITASDETRLLAYRVEAGRRGAGTLVRAAADRFAPPDTPEPPGVPLVEAVRVFRIRALDHDDVWRPAWTAPDLPRAVEIVLGVENEAGGVDELATTVALPRTGGG